MMKPLYVNAIKRVKEK